MFTKVIEILLYVPTNLRNYHKELEIFIDKTLKESENSQAIDVKIVNTISKDTQIVISLIGDTLSEFDINFHEKYINRDFRFLFYYFQDIEIGIDDFSDEVFERVAFKSEIEKDVKLYNNFFDIEEIKDSLKINLKESISDIIHKTNYSKINAHVINRSKGNRFYNNNNNLENVSKYLKRDKKISLISGLGGVGKSALAIEYAVKSIKDHIYDYAIWFDIENGIDFEIKKFAIEYLLDESNDGKQDNTFYKKIFTTFIQENPNSLIILDNLNYHAQYKKELEYFLYTYDDFDIIITAREHIKELGIQPIELNIFKSKDNALEMFKLISIRKYSLEEENTLREIIEYLGRLPLALEITANALSYFEDMQVKDYLEALNEEGLSVFEKLEDHNKHVESLRATLNVNEKIIKHEDSLTLLKVFSLISPEKIPQEIINKYIIKELDINNFNQSIALKNLERFSYITVSSDGYSMHRLLQEAIIDEFFPLKNTIQTELISKISLAILYWTYDGFSEANYGNYFNNAKEHVLYLLNRWGSILDISEAKIYLNTSYSAYIMNQSEDIELPLKLMTTAIALMANVDIDNEVKAIVCSQYGNVLKLNLEYERSIKAFETALSLSTEYKIISIIYENLADAYRQINMYDTAKSLLYKSLKLHINELGNSHPRVASVYGQLALIYENLKEYDIAIECNTKAIDINIKELGERHPNVAANKNNLAIIYDHMGRTKNAEILYQESLEIKKEAFGVNNPAVALGYRNISTFYTNHKRHIESFSAIYFALKIRLNLEISRNTKYDITDYFNRIIENRNNISHLERNHKVSMNKKIDELNLLFKEKEIKHKIKKLK